MKQQWFKVNEKFNQISPREKWLIIITGFVICIMLPLVLLIDGYNANINNAKRQNGVLHNDINDLTIKVNTLSAALGDNVNLKLQKEIKQYEQRLAKVDSDLLALSHDLINPTKMRSALLSILTLQKGVSLTSFEALPVIDILSFPEVKEELDVSTNVDKVKDIGLYQHGIEVVLTGSYFQLRDYLQLLEDTPWLFYWQQFDYQLIEYPVSELRIEIYTLSTEKEFIGV